MTQRILLRNISVLPMTSEEVFHAQDVLITDGVIASMQPTGSEYEQMEIIDGTGKFLMPGLFDAHVHMDHGFSPHFLMHGITAVRDCGNDKTIFELREAARTKNVLSPQLFISGQILEGDPPLWPEWDGIKNFTEAKKVIQELVDKGVDQIKVYHTLAPELYLQVVKEAAKSGLRVAGHIPFDVAIPKALDAGLQCIEHLNMLSMLGEYDYEPVTDMPEYEGWSRFVNPRINRKKFIVVLKSMDRHHTYLCPTLIVQQKLSELADFDSLRKSIDPSTISLEIVDSLWNPKSPHALANIKGIKPLWFENYGVTVRNIASLLPEVAKHATILAGTDTMNPFVIPGVSLHEELELLVAARLTPFQALQAATLNPAKYFGVEDQLGTVTPGSSANLIILTRNPLENISNIRSIETVILHGESHSKSSLQKRAKVLG